MLVDSRVLLLRFCRFGLAFLRIVPLDLCKSNFARFPHFTSLVIQYFAPTRLLPWPRPLHGAPWDLPSNLEGRVRGWVRRNGSPFHPGHIHAYVSREPTGQ